MMKKAMTIPLLFAALAACAGSKPDPDDPKPTSPATGDAGHSPTQDAGSADTALRQLGTEIRALAAASSCRSDADCDMSPYGHKACGGPRGYLVYGTLGVDTALLKEKIRQLNELEQRQNMLRGGYSDCDVATEPSSLHCRDGRCTAEGMYVIGPESVR